MLILSSEFLSDLVKMAVSGTNTHLRMAPLRLSRSVSGIFFPPTRGSLVVGKSALVETLVDTSSIHIQSTRAVLYKSSRVFFPLADRARTGGTPCSTGILPGSTATFKLAGPAKPGFLRAFFQGMDHGDPRGDMPNEVALEIEPYLTLEGSSQRRLLLGPAFALNVARNMMARSLANSVKQLFAERQMNPDSAFLREAMEILSRESVASSPNAGSGSNSEAVHFKPNRQGNSNMNFNWQSKSISNNRPQGDTQYTSTIVGKNHMRLI